MADDPYTMLGVARTATADEIRRAYRALAKKSHPDLHPGDKAAEARFKSINAANDLLSDPEKRGKFDRGEIAGDGQVPPPNPGVYRGQSRTGRRNGQASDAFFQEEDLGEMFGSMFRDQAGQTRRGRDRTYRLDVPFLDSVNGATERLTLPDGQTLDVRIPPGLIDGQLLRLRGKGDPGARGGTTGDALIETSILPHPLYRREGADVVADIPVTFAEAVLGARIEVPTPRGRVTLAVPPRSDAGARLRLRGRGVAAHGSQPAGDLYVTLRIVTGPVDEQLEAFLRDWAAKQSGQDPRAGLGEG